MLRAAVYARVSSKEQVDGHSLDAQLRDDRQLCEQRGYEVVAVLVCEGM